MPRPRSQRAPPAEQLQLEPPSEELQAARPAEQPTYKRALNSAEEDLLRNLPNTLPRDLKLGALNYGGCCFCCPAGISFAQCIVGLWQAAERPVKSADSLVHWGLNASKFLYEAGPNTAAVRAWLLHAGFVSLAPQLLKVTNEVPQTTFLTPQVSFTQVFATGSRQLKLSTTPQLVILGLLMQLSSSPVAMRAIAASADLAPALVRALAATDDDRFRALALQTLGVWLGSLDDPDGPEGSGAGSSSSGSGADGAAASSGSGAQEQGRSAELDAGGGGNSGGGSGGGGAGGGRVRGRGLSLAEQAAFLNRMLDSGLLAALVDVLERSSSAPVIRDACGVLLPLLAGAGNHGGGGGGSGVAEPGEAHGRQGHGVSLEGLTSLVLPSGAALEGVVRCRARAGLLKAGVVPVLLAAMSRRPSQLSYWLSVNMGVSGARLLEAQWWLLVIARLCLLPERTAVSAVRQQCQALPADQLPSTTGPDSTAEGAAGTATTSAAAGSTGVDTNGAVAASDRGGAGGSGGARGEAAAAVNAGAEAGAERERLRVTAAELVLRSSVLRHWLGEAEAEGGDEAAAGGAGAEEEGKDGGAAADSSSGSRVAEVAPDGEAAEAAAAAGQSEPERALRLLSAALAATSTRSCCLTDGVPLDQMPPAERNATPDWRALQRERIRKAAEEARAAQAQASATAAVDVLSRAMAEL